MPPAFSSPLPGLPGLTLPLNFQPPDEDTEYGARLFPTALQVQDLVDGTSILPLRTLRELTMLRLMDHITDKPGWQRKVFNDELTDKWRDELQGSGQDVSGKMLDFIIAELRDKAEFYKENEDIVIAYEGGIVKSDRAVSEHTRLALVDAVRVLEEESTPPDYHPGSDNKVVDLVHPSLFPLVYGKTHVLQDRAIALEDALNVHPSQGTVIPVPPAEETNLPSAKPDYVDYSRVKPILKPYSGKFQWLPSDVDLWGSDTGCKLASYINNLHPTRHARLYGLVEEIIDCAIPLWNLTLGPLGERSGFLGSRMEDYYPSYRTEKPANGRRFTADEVIQPEARDYHRVPTPYIGLQHSQWYKLQVIVKLANIELTPEKPEYAGGSWHVEGQLNEHICATALYYYDSVNITESRLSFRQESSFVQHSYIPHQIDPWIGAVYGCKDHGPRVQEILSVQCRQGRLVTFSNIFQHRVVPFSLVDGTKPGHRKILALFLVDPNVTVISTANVPVQRADWWEEGQDGTAGLMSMQEAKEFRDELMDERKAFAGDQDEAFHSLSFNLCEH
ncbi:hypothetical protein BJY01DRAFT_264474 [Aspergillus pseudoustus]|uniref:Uncharacterized protein n=1 Tax=Aspergillus pseudoustus TaxID=1810923 RepID=A0ABR4JR72_9EURO